nr:unnamed protein product [Callosobruchus analis]
MALSKPVMNALSFYFGQLFEHPKLSGSKALDYQSLLAYGIYGLAVGGTIPHYFYSFLDWAVPEDAAFSIAKKLLLERLVYSPLYQAFTLYALARLEGKDHDGALEQLQHLYWPVLTSSWKYLTLRVLIINLIGFFWTIYIANKRRQEKNKENKKK